MSSPSCSKAAEEPAWAGGRGAVDARRPAARDPARPRAAPRPCSGRVRRPGAARAAQRSPAAASTASSSRAGPAVHAGAAHAVASRPAARAPAPRGRRVRRSRRWQSSASAAACEDGADGMSSADPLAGERNVPDVLASQPGAGVSDHELAARPQDRPCPCARRRRRPATGGSCAAAGGGVDLEHARPVGPLRELHGRASSAGSARAPRRSPSRRTKSMPLTPTRPKARVAAWASASRRAASAFLARWSG